MKASLVCLAAAAGLLGPTAAERQRLRNGFSSRPIIKVPTVREEACRFCYRECPISCFAGTCGLEYGFSVRRYKFTNQCYSCDASSSVGINKAGDFTLCGADESAATFTYIKTPKDGGPTGRGIPGDARKAAQAASDAANLAVKNAQEAAEQADKAAMAAVAKYRSVSNAAGQDGNAEQQAEAHRLAEQIRAQEYYKAAEAAQMARKISEKKYNDELFKLRKQQLVTDSAEEVLQRAEKAAEDARNQYTQAAARVAQAAREAANTGAEAAGRAAEQAEADELASAAKAAQRRAIVAAKAAKDAADKANIAATMAEIPPQPKPTLPPCNPNLKASLLQANDGKACQMMDTMGMDAAPPMAPGASFDPPPLGGAPPMAPGASFDASAPPPMGGAPPMAPGAVFDAGAGEPSPGEAPSAIAFPAGMPQPMAQARARAPVRTPAAPRKPVEAVSMAAAEGDGEDGEDGDLSPPMKMPSGDQITEQMATDLAEKIQENPSEINNPANYDIAQMPVIQAEMNANSGLGAQQQAPVESGLNFDPASVPDVGQGLDAAGFDGSLLR